LEYWQPSQHLYFLFWVFPRRQIKFCRRFGTLCQVHLQRLDKEYSSAKLNLTPGKYPKENIQVPEHGENLKSRISAFAFRPRETKKNLCRGGRSLGLPDTDI
jgi:hypothetical protein